MALESPSFLRPRLSPRALPRLHFVEGRCRVLLHDVESGDVVEIGPREWVLLAGADGTRDLDGVVMAASREGVLTDVSALKELLLGLSPLGMVEEGPLPRKGKDAAAKGEDGATLSVGAKKIAKEKRPIERLSNYSFHCDGHGSCCQIYATVVFSPLEVARARALLPNVLDAGEREAHAFMPVRGTGNIGGNGEGKAVAIVDGRCAYLDGSLCSLHRAGDARSKPLGCNLFPLALVDDGERVRASVSVECACVLSSVGKPGGSPIVAESALVRGDLDPAIVVDELPQVVDLSASQKGSLAEYLRWCDGVLAALPPDGDSGRLSWALANSLDAAGFDVEHAVRVLAEPPEVDLRVAERYLQALSNKAARRAKSQQAWRSERDLCRRGVSIIAASASLLLDSEVLSAVVCGAGRVKADEEFYLYVTLFGHQLVGYPMAKALRDRAIVMWIGRMFPLAADALYDGAKEPAFGHPLALVEALFRGHGLRRYVEEIDAQPVSKSSGGGGFV